MPGAPHPRPKLRRIPLSDILPRPGHTYRMSPRVRRSLLEQMADSGLYPPLIVRPHPCRGGKFEILDGHQRAAVLRELGAADARCEVWCVSDAQAEVYAASLNHLRGRPEAKRRARQLRRLIHRLGRRRAGELLALTPAAIRQQLSVLRRPEKLEGGVRPLELHPVVFHLRAADVKLLRRRLQQFGAAGPRSEALMAALRGAAGPDSALSRHNIGTTQSTSRSKAREGEEKTCPI